MSVSKDDVRKVARLSRIAVQEEALEQLSHELSSILDWIEQLNEVDVEGSPCGKTLWMMAQSLSVFSQTLPEEMMASLSSQNLLSSD